MKRLKEYFSNKTGEQIFSLCLLVGVIALMLFCTIVRLCGGLWFTADMSTIPEPSKFWQEVIKGLLLFVEAIFMFKILCRKSWLVCGIIAFTEVVIGIAIGELFDNYLVSNIFYAFCYLIVPFFIVRKAYSFIDNVILYGLSILYSLIFMVGRIGNVDTDAAYNFIYGILSTIDFKLFFISMYLFIKYFGGIRLWKSQKRLIFQDVLPTKNETE